MARYGKNREHTGRDEAWAEDDDFTYQGDPYTVRVTALYPYKDYANGGDELYAHIDWKNLNTGETGRFSNVWIEERLPKEHLRRYATYRTLRVLLAQQTKEASPVFGSN